MTALAGAGRARIRKARIGRGKALSALLVSATTCGALAGWGPSWAQDGDQVPPRLSFDVSAGLSHATNPGLEVTGAEARSRGDLSFGLTWADVTRDQDFHLALGGLLRATGSGDDESGFQDPSVDLSYTRTGANGLFSVEGSWDETPVDLSEPLELPGGGYSSSDVLATTGTVTTTRAALALQLGQEGPLGAQLSASHLERGYSETTDPSVYDTTTTSLSAGVTLRDAMGGDLGLHWDQTQSDQDDATATARDRRSLSLSWDRPLTGVLMLNLSLGMTEAETVKSGTTVSESSGATGTVGLTGALANGSWNVTLDSARDSLGTRQTLSLGRDLVLPTGSLSAEIGVTARDGGEADVVGRLDWSHEMPGSQLTLGLSREVSLNSDDADAAQTALDAGWSRDLTPTAKLGLSYALTRIEAAGDAAVEGATRQSLQASLTKTLPSDWQLRTGVQFKSLDRESKGSAQDNSVFLTIGRSFVLLP